MKVHVKQRCVIEFLHSEKMAPTDISQHLLNVYSSQTVDVSTVRWSVVHFSRGGCDRVTSAGVDFDECGMQTLHHWQESTANGGD